MTADMRIRCDILAQAAFVCIAARAHADGVAYWLWDVTTDDADAIVEPGETATVTISLLMELDPGDGPFVAIAASIFDTLGDAGAANGHVVSWDVLNELDNLTGDTTTSDGVSLYNTQAGQLTLAGGPFTSDNPIEVFTFEWAPTEFASYDVCYHTVSTIEDEHVVFVCEGRDKNSADAIPYRVIDADISFTVVPAPAAALALLAWPILARQRRRT